MNLIHSVRCHALTGATVNYQARESAMQSFDSVIRDTWPTATQRRDFSAFAIGEALSDPAIRAANEWGLRRLEEFANGQQES